MTTTTSTNTTTTTTTNTAAGIRGATMGQRMRKWMAVAALAVAASASGVASAQNCAGFVDVPASSPFCPSVEWLKNRGITTGCAIANSYCPDAPVSRLAMAAFMKRLGTALTPIQLRVDTAPGTADLDDANLVVCQTGSQTIDGFPRRAYVDAVFSATAVAEVTLAADLVQSTDGGTNWTAMNTVGNKGTIGANQWGGLADLAYADLPVSAQPLKWGIRLSRGGVDRHDRPQRQPLPAARAAVQSRRRDLAVLSGTGRGPRQAARAPRCETAMPPAISAKASAWKRCGGSPSNAVDMSAASSGVMLAKKAGSTGPACATPRSQHR